MLGGCGGELAICLGLDPLLPLIATSRRIYQQLRNLATGFGTVEWPEILEAIEEDAPEAAGWIRWEQKDAEEIELPSGEVHYSNRGAGQGFLGNGNFRGSY